MKLSEFSITNFRSITRAYKILFKDITILIGKNNEGKSNLLSALSICMNILDNHASSRSRFISGRYKEYEYIWERDYPISLQSRSSKKPTVFRLEFELDTNELAEFKSQIGSNLNGSLPIEITINEDSKPNISVVKSGKGSSSLNKKSSKIAKYIGSKIYFNNIPAIRTDKTFLDIIERTLNKELLSIEETPEYLSALETIKNLQEPIISNLSYVIKTSLSEFLPNIKDVEISLYENRRRFYLRNSYDVYIDDGYKTHISLKGDGVKSLSALGVLKNISRAEGTYSLIAIEEPESHLHPEAIHLLKEQIYELRKNNQVIISSHNPLFVDRENIGNNIIVDSGSATMAKNIKSIRDILGVKASDNLINASFVLVVEGEDDEISLKALLCNLSDKLEKAFKQNLLVIEKLGGASNLTYKLNSLKTMLCNYHVFLDHDTAGRNAFDKAKEEGLVDIKNITFVTCNGLVESEFEDCLNTSLYESFLKERFGITLDCKDYKKNIKKKWSDKMRACFLGQGKPWNDKIKAELKSSIANLVSRNPNIALNNHHSNSINALVTSLKELIKTN